MASNLKTRGAVVYRLASAIKFAAFKFLAATTAIFIWASFNHYFLEKFGAGIAAVMSIVAIIVMFFLIDKGLDAIIEFLADERINPGAPASDENPKARRTFMRTVMFLALIRLIATGTTSIWGSYEIADYITEAPDNTEAIGQMKDENKNLEAARNSLDKQLAAAKKTEHNRMQQARQQGATLVEGALAQHASQDVRQGLRAGKKWYMTSNKVKKVRTAYLAAIADSAKLVQVEVGKVSAIESELLTLNTSGFKATQEIKNTLARSEEAKVQAYESRKGRRTNFLIIADVLSVLFGLLAVWVRATFRAAVGVHSITEEKSVEGILLAAVVRVWNAFLGWLERVLKVDIDGNGHIGMAGGTGAWGGSTGAHTGAVAQHRQIGFFGRNNQGATTATNNPQQGSTPVANSVAGQQQINITTGVDAEKVKQLQQAITRLRASIRADESNLRNGNGVSATITDRLARKAADLIALQTELENELA